MGLSNLLIQESYNKHFFPTPRKWLPMNKSTFIVSDGQTN